MKYLNQLFITFFCFFCILICYASDNESSLSTEQRIKLTKVQRLKEELKDSIINYNTNLGIVNYNAELFKKVANDQETTNYDRMLLAERIDQGIVKVKKSYQDYTKIRDLTFKALEEFYDNNPPRTITKSYQDIDMAIKIQTEKSLEIVNQTLEKAKARQQKNEIVSLETSYQQLKAIV